MKVCHVCNGHSADDGRVFHRACVSLAEAGYEVHLFAVGKGREAYCHRGVTIHPLPECQSRTERLMRRSRVAQMAAALRPDLFHVHEPELLGPVIGLAKSCPVIYDVHESYLDVLKQRDWIPKWLKPLVGVAWDRRERQLASGCAGVVVVTERIAQRYHRFHKKVRVVCNFPDLSQIEDLPAVMLDGKTCVYAGVLRPDRGLAQILAALAILKGRGLPVSLALAGSPLSKEYLCSLWDEVDRLAIRELVNYHGVLSKEEAMALQQGATIGLVPNLPTANNMAGIPTKLLECMALGVPVVFSNFPSFYEIAGVSRAGIAVDPTKPEQIANAVEHLIRNPTLALQMGEAGKRAVQERFNWSVERAQLLELYKDILGVLNQHGPSEEAQLKDK